MEVLRCLQAENQQFEVPAARRSARAELNNCNWYKARGITNIKSQRTGRIALMPAPSVERWRFCVAYKLRTTTLMAAVPAVKNNGNEG
jgi:hypothetical protein